MGGIFSSPSPPPPPAPPPPPTRSDAEVQDAAMKERQRRAAAIGRNETIRTSGQGVTDGVQPAANKLLGE
jgi:hypothetical protein